MKPTLGALLVLALASAGCSRGAQPPLPQDTFVTTMVELRRAAAGEQDSVFEDSRREILERRGVTEAELHAYVRWAARDPDRLRETFDQITERLREPIEQ